MTGRRLILVADDDADILALIKAVLERSGHEVVAVADGAEALAGLEDLLHPDVADTAVGETLEVRAWVRETVGMVDAEPVDQAVRSELEVIAWRDGLKRK